MRNQNRFVLVVAAFLAAANILSACDGEVSSPCAPVDMDCWSKVGTGTGGTHGAGEERGFFGTVGASIRTMILLGVWIGGYQLLRLIPNVVFNFQRALQLFAVPFLVFVLGVGLGNPGQGFLMSLAAFLFSGWFRRTRQVHQGGGQQVQAVPTEAWPIVPGWLRYVIAGIALVIGITSC